CALPRYCAARDPRPPSFTSVGRATPDFYPLSLHDALPISSGRGDRPFLLGAKRVGDGPKPPRPRFTAPRPGLLRIAMGSEKPQRSEEHTSELQSRENIVCRLLLEKKTGLYWRGTTSELADS